MSPRSRGQTGNLRSSDEEQFFGIFSNDRLRKTWKNLRRELRDANTRDIIDWTDWALTIESSFRDIGSKIVSGDYVPTRATRIESGKTKGAFRVISGLNVLDALIYRHICDLALERALPNKVKGAYYSRRKTPTPVGRSFEPIDNPSDQFYPIWLRYNEYRTKTLLNEPYQILVITDISNYFDSIQHDLLFEYLAPLGIPRMVVGLLGRLLEALRPESGHSPSPRVGLPTDELDCSRQLAHIFLFEHDRRIVQKCGERNYVRWMDDQNIGVKNDAEARRTVNLLNRSLNQQRLTLNSGKTTFLTPDQVAAHFQLDANEELQTWWERLDKQQGQISKALKQQLFDSWHKYSTGVTAERGNWDKVLKRFYGYATRADMSFLEHRALDDLVRYPDLCERIFAYFARRNKGKELLQLFRQYAKRNENIFETTEHHFFDSLLLLDPTRGIAKQCLELARKFAANEYYRQTRRPLGRATALIALYWFGADAKTIAEIFSPEEAARLPKEVARAWLTCTAVLDPGLLTIPITALFGHQSDDVLRLVRFLQAVLQGEVDSLGNYKNQKSRYPLPRKHYDARAWLLLELASQGGSSELRARTKNDLTAFGKLVYTQQERVILDRVRVRVS